MSTTPPKSSSVFEELELFPGDFVKARYHNNEFYLATVELDNRTGSFVLRWADTGEVYPWQLSHKDLLPLEGQNRPSPVPGGLESMQYFVGDVVWAQWSEDCGWYMATLEKGHSDGTFTLQWADNSLFETSTDPGKLKSVPFYHRGHGVRFYLTESSRYPRVLEVSVDETAASGSPTKPVPPSSQDWDEAGFGSPTARTVLPSSRDEVSSESLLSGEEEEEEEEPCFVEQPITGLKPALPAKQPPGVEKEVPDIISAIGIRTKWSKLVTDDEAISFPLGGAEPMPEPAPSVHLDDVGAPTKQDRPLAEKAVKARAGAARNFRLPLKPPRSTLPRTPAGITAVAPKGSARPPAAKVQKQPQPRQEERPAQPLTTKAGTSLPKKKKERRAQPRAAKGAKQEERLARAPSAQARKALATRFVSEQQAAQEERPELPPGECPTFLMTEGEPSTEEEMPPTPRGEDPDVLAASNGKPKVIELETMFEHLGNAERPLEPQKSVWG